ncbi:hypothetical protein MSAN_00872700 [Mycena sanguinolenta]|uniref:Uncharacterized protein n=1 Tax=Mycena sanguinolenta TaxID=230812 RepID=A0A8H7DE01_9AGAR|nr:hypothetical protein MSAN_00872700 [Mycena sanguinolenta]
MPSLPCVIPTGSFLLKDFQQLCLTVSSITGGLYGQNITTAPCSDELPALPQQTWSLAPADHSSVLVSGLSQGPSEIVLLAESNGEAITASTTSFEFNVTCDPGNLPQSVVLVDNRAGTWNTLTSTQAKGDTAQVIFETFRAEGEQIWSMHDLD